MPDKKDFIIKDRRIFSEEEKKEPDRAEPSQKEAEAPETEDVGQTGAPEEDYPLPEITFPTFIFSLNSSTLVHLGIIDDPATGKKLKNLPLAKQTIDILGMLEEKTRGNLSKEEESMLKNILYDLRMIYVKEKA